MVVIGIVLGFFGGVTAVGLRMNDSVGSPGGWLDRKHIDVDSEAVASFSEVRVGEGDSARKVPTFAKFEAFREVIGDVRYGRVDAVRKWIENGGDVTMQQWISGRSLFHVALDNRFIGGISPSRNHLEILKILSEANVSGQVIESNFVTPALLAARSCDVDALKVLLCYDKGSREQIEPIRHDLNWVSDMLSEESRAWFAADAKQNPHNQQVNEVLDQFQQDGLADFKHQFENESVHRMVRSDSGDHTFYMQDAEDDAVLVELLHYIKIE